MRLLRITETHDYDLIGTLLPLSLADAPGPVTQPPNLIQIAPNFVIPNQIPVR
jgi:hypothetical protein